MDLARLRYRTAWTRVANERAYDAPADPWDPIDVDPAAVEHYTNELRLNWGLGRVQGGDWDRAGRESLAEMVTARGLRQRFEEGRDWTETDLYDWAADQVAEHGAVRGYEDLETFREVRLAYLDDLHASIRDEGYRANAEAGHEPASTDNAFEEAYAHRLEPIVGIGRDGEVLWAEGYHRLLVAAIVGVETIPVQVLCRHAEWQALRDRVAAAGADALPAGVDAAHPDLQDL